MNLTTNTPAAGLASGVGGRLRPAAIFTVVALTSLAAVSHAQMAGACPPGTTQFDVRYDSNNGQSGNFFDVEATGGIDVTIANMAINVDAGGPYTVEVWTRPGTYVGFTASSAGWTQIINESVMGVGLNLATPLATTISEVIPAGQVTGFLCVLNGSTAMNYTNGTAVGAVSASDANLTVYQGQGCSSPGFGGSLFTTRNWNGSLCYTTGPGCMITAPAAGSLLAGVVQVDHDVTNPGGPTIATTTYEWSTDGGAIFNACTPTMGSVNPALMLPSPSSQMFFWDSITDGIAPGMLQTVIFRISLDDPVGGVGDCTVSFDVDNRPAPTCTLAPVVPGVQSLVPVFDLTPDSTFAPTVDVTFDYSLDMGLTWLPATPGGTSTNPILGAPVMVVTPFEWDTLLDGVGIAAPAVGVLFRSLVTDGIATAIGECNVMIDVDNSGSGICGDCNGDGILTVTDALLAAQNAAGLAMVTGSQFSACNVNGIPGTDATPGATVDVVDALLLAQGAAGLPVALNCNTLPSCSLTSPVGGTQMGDVAILFDALDLQGDPLTISFEYDTGAGFVPATAAVSSPLTSPAVGVAPGAGLQFTWDSLLDVPATLSGVRFRVTVDDGIGFATGCSSTFDVDNPGAPVCSITSPLGGSEMGNISIDFDVSDGNQDPVTITFEYDAGAGFLPATPEGTSPLANPATGVIPGTGLNFGWASRADIASANVLGLVFRITVDDGILPPTSCTTMFDLYNFTLDMTPHAIGIGDVNQPYSVTFTGQGGSGMGYTFAQTGGSLPAGVTLDPMGVLSGTPTVSGGHYFTVTLTDSLMNSVVREYLLQVRVPEVYLACPGDIYTDNLYEVALVDVSTAIPGIPFPTFATPPALGDAYYTTNAANKISPDGRYLAYLADFTIDNTDDVYVVDLTAPSPVAVNVTNITSGGDAEHFEWSPDGRKLAISGDFRVLNDDEVVIIDLSPGLPGNRLFTLLPVPLGDAYPTSATTSNDDTAWSLDSTKYYFKGDLIVDNVIEAYMFDLNNPSAGAQLLHPPLSGGLDVFTITAAGANMAIIVGELDLDLETSIYAVDTTGGVIGTPVRLNPLLLNADAGTGSFDTRAAPGGRYVAFVGDFQLDGSDDLWIADLRDGVPGLGSALPLTNFGDTIFDAGFDPIEWSPTGDKLVLLADATVNGQEEALFVDLRGGGPTTPVRISAPPTTFEDTDEMRWAPDGSGIALEGTYNTSGIEELFYVDLSGPVPGMLIQLSVAAPVATGDVEGDVKWLPDSSGVVYVHDATSSGLNDLYLATPPMSMAPVKLNAAYPSGAGTVGVTVPNDFFVTRDSQRVVAIGDVFVDNQNEVFMVDIPTAPNVIPVVGVVPNGDIGSIVLHDYEYR